MKQCFCCSNALRSYSCHSDSFHMHVVCSQVICSVPVSLFGVPVTVPQLLSTSKQVWPADKANPQMPHTVPSSSWFCFRITWLSFMNDPVGTLLRSSLILHVRETDVEGKKKAVRSYPWIWYASLLSWPCTTTLNYFSSRPRNSGAQLLLLVFSDYILTWFLVQNCS